MEYAFGDERVDCMARNKSAVFVIIIAECVNNKPQHLFKTYKYVYIPFVSSSLRSGYNSFNCSSPSISSPMHEGLIQTAQ